MDQPVGTMSTEANRETARRFAEVWTPEGLHFLDELAAPDIVVSYPVPPEPMRGVEAFRSFLESVFEGIPDAALTIEELVAEGDTVAGRWTWGGTHTGPLFGIPATGKRLKVTGFTFYRIADGKVTRESGMGAPSLMEQLAGAVGPPGSGPESG